MRRFIPLLALTAVACAPVTKQPQITNDQARSEADRQLEASIRRHVILQERAMNVFRPITTANVDLCGDKVRRSIGVNFIFGNSLPANQQPIYSRLYNANGSDMAVMFALKGSPGAAAGIQPGDVVESFEGMTRGEIAGVVPKKDRTIPVTLHVRRAGEVRTVTVQPELICDYPLAVTMQEIVNAFADGKKVVVTSGMMKFVESDDELALVLGHELAHNTMGHLDKKKGNEFVGVLLGATLGVLSGGLATGSIMDSSAAAGRAAFSQEFEGEADYVGVYHAARAGYRVADAAALWRRMGEANPTSIHLEGSSHPSTAKRFLAIEAAAAEVERKRAGGEPLAPDL